MWSVGHCAGQSIEAQVEVEEGSTEGMREEEVEKEEEVEEGWKVRSRLATPIRRGVRSRIVFSSTNRMCCLHIKKSNHILIII